MRARLAPPVYAPHLLVRRVAPSGVLTWHQRQIYLSLTYRGDDVGLDPVCALHFDVYFMEYLLGALDVHALRFRPLTKVVTSPINPVQTSPLSPPVQEDATTSTCVRRGRDSWQR